MNSARWLLTFLVLASAHCVAAPAASVEAVVAPAWLDRDGILRPLEPGTPLEPGDRVRTGALARVSVKFIDGSRTKLGEQASLDIERIDAKAGVLKAALAVARGAFRFTTGILQRAGGRDVTIRVATLTAGIRGTDVWGRSDQAHDLICLLEGRIAVAHAGGTRVVMDRPNTFFVAQRGRDPDPVAPVDPDQVRKWAEETEIGTGQGAAREGGSWSVIALDAASEPEALDAYERLRVGGYPAELHPVSGAGRRYDVRVARFTDAREAEAAAARIRRAFGLERARAGR